LFAQQDSGLRNSYCLNSIEKIIKSPMLLTLTKTNANLYLKIADQFKGGLI
jgi:hypothetical protein